MKGRITLGTLGIGLLVAVFLIAGCSSNKPEPKSGLVKELVDSVGSAFVQNVLETALVQNVSAVDTVVAEKPEGAISEIADMIIAGPKLYAAFDGGVIVYDFLNKEQKIFRVDDRLRAVTAFEDKIYVGGSDLYTVGDTGLEKVDDSFEGTVTALYSYGFRLMVGTTTGLYSTGVFGKELLYDDITVTALVSDESGVWVGTDGQGLYRWDGETFHKRYLLRDTTMFDHVNTLAFNHQHLYVGTDRGLHIFDGGRWENLSTAEGLPSDFVRDIDASQWVVYIATDKGVTSYYNDDFMPVDQLVDRNVSVVAFRKGRIIAGTDSDGILYRANNTLKTLVEPVEETNESMISAIE
jgi:ligand-binding sensor domain-containing protein